MTAGWLEGGRFAWEFEAVGCRNGALDATGSMELNSRADSGRIR